MKNISHYCPPSITSSAGLPSSTSYRVCIGQVRSRTQGRNVPEFHWRGTTENWCMVALLSNEAAYQSNAVCVFRVVAPFRDWQFAEAVAAIR